MWQTFRTVVLNDGIDDEIDQLKDTIERFDDTYRALEWILARNPEIGQHRVVDGSRWYVHVQASDRLAHSPEIWVLYQFDDNEVTIFGLRAEPYDDEESD